MFINRLRILLAHPTSFCTSCNRGAVKGVGGAVLQVQKKSSTFVRHFSVQPGVQVINGTQQEELPKKNDIQTQKSFQQQQPQPLSITTTTAQKRSQMLSLTKDVEHIKMILAEVELLEHLLHEDQEEHNNQVTNRSVELRGMIKHLVTNREFCECLDRLENEGKPIWGLSSDEHDLIAMAREKINQC